MDATGQWLNHRRRLQLDTVRYLVEFGFGKRNVFGKNPIVIVAQHLSVWTQMQPPRMAVDASPTGFQGCFRDDPVTYPEPPDIGTGLNDRACKLMADDYRGLLAYLDGVVQHVDIRPADPRRLQLDIIC